MTKRTLAARLAETIGVPAAQALPGRGGGVERWWRDLAERLKVTMDRYSQAGVLAEPAGYGHNSRGDFLKAISGTLTIQAT